MPARSRSVTAVPTTLAGDHFPRLVTPEDLTTAHAAASTALVRTLTSLASGQMMLYPTDTGTVAPGATIPSRADSPRSMTIESHGRRSTLTTSRDCGGVR